MKRKCQVQGLTLLQLMFILGSLGIIAWLVLTYVVA